MLNPDKQNLLVPMLEYPHGILAIDADFHRPRMAAAWLLEAGDEVAFVEVGTNHTTPRLLEALRHRGHEVEQVRYVIVTHVHLDHAGGVGSLMQALPHAELVVHPRGARHMIDPAKLEAGARAVYGDELFDRTYGTLQGVAAERVIEMADGDSLTVGNRSLTFIDSPGHAKHHFCVWDETSRGWFSGDTFGLSYREFDTRNGAFIFPTTTPIHFDPDALHHSIDRLMETDPQAMYLTHFGRVTEVPRLATDLHRGIDRLVAIAHRHQDAQDRTERISSDMTEWLLGALRKHGCHQDEARLRYLIEADVQLNTQGIEFWLDHG